MFYLCDCLIDFATITILTAWYRIRIGAKSEQVLARVLAGVLARKGVLAGVLAKVLAQLRFCARPSGS